MQHPDDTFDPSRPIDEEAVAREVADLIRGGYAQIDPERLPELGTLMICRALVGGVLGPAATVESIRAGISKMVRRLDETADVRKPVAEALLGMDEETWDKPLEYRGNVAGGRYSPARPVSYDGMRKRPHGQIPKLGAYLTEALIDSERSARYSSYELQGDLAELGEGSPIEIGGLSSIGGTVSRGAPSMALPPAHELEQLYGYRWTSYHCTLVAAEDLSQLHYIYEVTIEITQRGARLYWHRTDYAGHDAPSERGRAPSGGVATDPGQLAYPDYVGRVPADDRVPNSWIEFYDFGAATEVGDKFTLCISHCFDNPERDLPHRVMCDMEFDGLAECEIAAGRLLGDGGIEPLTHPLRRLRDNERASYQLLVNAPREIWQRFRLSDPADFPKYDQLWRHYVALNDQMVEAGLELDAMLRPVQPGQLNWRYQGERPEGAVHPVPPDELDTGNA